MVISKLTIRNDHHGKSTNHLHGTNDPSIPFRGDLNVEECRQGEHFGVFHVLLALQLKWTRGYIILGYSVIEL